MSRNYCHFTLFGENYYFSSSASIIMRGALFQSCFNVTAIFLYIVFYRCADAINLIHYFSEEKLFLVFATLEHWLL